MLPLWTGLVATLPPSAVCNHLQRLNHSIEFIDFIDVQTPIYGYCIEIDTPYIRGRVYRQPCRLSYTKEVVGSSPIPPTERPLGFGVFLIKTRRCPMGSSTP